MSVHLKDLMKNDGAVCPSCGKRHFGLLRDYIAKENAIAELPALLKKYTCEKPFVLCDPNTYRAAGKRVEEVLKSAEIPFSLHVMAAEKPAPDERTVGEALMYCDGSCDSVIAVGGGVINDTCKIIAAAKKVPDIIVATAPSMDGFASASSSMERSGLKISLNSKCPEAVIADPDILVHAPKRMILSGIGDILAKYVSLTEWKIAHILVGDFYCETIAEIVKDSLAQCVRDAKAAVNGDKNAVLSVMEALVISGIAMNYAGISRPASGMEHYISHIVDMRALEWGTPCDFHGIQCAVATLTTVRAYEECFKTMPNREKALAAVASWDNEKWNVYLREKLGKGAKSIIAGEEKERKYDKEKHTARLEKIIFEWDLLAEIVAKLPSSEELESFMKDIGHPTEPEELGLTSEQWQEAFRMAKDIRDKYVLGRLLWDLGDESMHTV
ncbi:MAG: sn-glycerol-1-phosphate dehydrogenase [Ruminococcaceae bacterium]|nr:sn-glycerol-1-phosphate dehydrogenase [Oscillospiraceae bacterium]